MDYQIKPIYSVSNSLGGDSTWCSTPESLVLAIHNDENVGCSGDGYIQEQDDTEEFFQNKVSKKIGIYLDDSLLRICQTVEEADQTIIKLKNFSKKIEEMKVNESIRLLDHDLFKSIEDDD